MKIRFKEDYNNYKKGDVIEVVEWEKQSQTYLTYDYKHIYYDIVEEVPGDTPETVTVAASKNVTVRNIHTSSKTHISIPLGKDTYLTIDDTDYTISVTKNGIYITQKFGQKSSAGCSFEYFFKDNIQKP